LLADAGWYYIVFDLFMQPRSDLHVWALVPVADKGAIGVLAHTHAPCPHLRDARICSRQSFGWMKGILFSAQALIMLQKSIYWPLSA
jgi:hypothetical protein